jgi:hypothetical protein
MKKTLINFTLAALLSFSAYAIQEKVSIWTNITGAGTEYVDTAHASGEITIKGFQKKIGSRTEKNIQLRIESFKKVGSRAEFNYFVGDVKEGTDLPQTISIFKSSAAWNKIGSRSEGSFAIDTADKKSITGTLLNNPVSANATSN